MIKLISAIKAVALACTLLLGACDGGIFGTGSGDDIIIPGTTEPTNGSAIDESTADTVDGATDTSDSTTEETDTVNESVDTATDEDTLSVGDTPTESSTDVITSLLAEPFSNDTVTLSQSSALIGLFNATAMSLNAFDTSNIQAQLLFGTEGVTPLSLSASVVESNALNSLSIVNAQDAAEQLVVYPEFVVADSTLTTLVVRQFGLQIDALALTTETTTNDAMLARIRAVQAGSANDPATPVSLSLLSAGTDPGGIDISFSTLDFDNPYTEYLEVPAGQYELNDEFDSITPQTLTLVGGSVYTIMVTGDASNETVIVNDTELGQ